MVCKWIYSIHFYHRIAPSRSYTGILFLSNSIFRTNVFVRHPSTRFPSHIYVPWQYEDFKCWPEEGKYVSDSSPPFSYVKGHSPFNIVAPRYTYEKLLHKHDDPDVTNFFLNLAV